MRPTKRGQSTKLLVSADAHGLPIAVHTASASPHEIILTETTVYATFTYGLPQQLIGDLAYDRDSLDDILAANNIELIAPHRRNRKHATQDGRPPRRYNRRWKFERLLAWLSKYRRILLGESTTTNASLALYISLAQ